MLNKLRDFFDFITLVNCKCKLNKFYNQETLSMA